MSALSKFVNTEVPQTEKSRTDQVKNNAGGFVFKTADVSRLERFLILGVDGGTYYVGERDLTASNVDFIRDMIANDPKTVLTTVVDVSDKGRAYRNEAAIFVMALMLSEPEKVPGVKQEVIAAIPSVVRTATHVYQLASFIEGLGGWGRAKRKAVAAWFESKTTDQLAYQAVKYRSRTTGGQAWTLRDTMRLAHPKNVDVEVGNFILGKYEAPVAPNRELPIFEGFKQMQQAHDVNEVRRILMGWDNLPWETIPTEFLKDAEVWKALFANGQLQGQALVRNITRLSRIGAFNDMVFAREIADKLVDSDMIAKTRLHPIQYLLASVTHREGQLQRSGGSYYYSSGTRNKDWATNPVIADALDEGFYKAFKSVVPADKRTMLALDVSGSMGQNAMGIDLSCAQVTAAMAMITARTEPYYMIRGFSTTLKDLGITPKQDFGTVMRKVRDNNFGGTDCAAPMQWALANKVEVDTFGIFTDNETWAGPEHVYKSLERYRQKMGIDAKLAVFGVASTPFSIADPNDPKRQMDFVGFDSNAASVFADFSAGRL